jgi:hypothetical protein
MTQCGVWIGGIQAVAAARLGGGGPGLGRGWIEARPDDDSLRTDQGRREGASGRSWLTAADRSFLVVALFIVSG